MKQTYSVAASYRYRVDPETSEVSPLAVWSPLALRDRIVEAEISATTVSSDDSHADVSLDGPAPASASSSASADSVTSESDDAGDVTPGEKA